MKFGISLALIVAAAPCLAETAAGFAHLRDTSVAERPLSMSIWYPSEEQASGTIGGNAVFEGASAASDAPFLEGALPLVVLSHGGLRSATDSGAWLSSSIAQAGFVVVEVNAPRPDNAHVALNEIWQRPQDIRRVIDLVLSDEAWGPRIDESKVSVAGFALGATAGGNREARENMLLGAMLAGQAFANSPVAAVHALAYPLGGHYHLPHGLTNALMLGPVLRMNAKVAAPLYAELADAVSIPGQGNAEERSEAFVNHMLKLMDESGAPRRLRDVDVTDNSLSMLAADAMKQQRLLVNNPVEVTEEVALELYREAY